MTFTEAFDEQAAYTFRAITPLADSAVEYYVKTGNPVGGMLAGILTSDNIGNTTRQVGMGVLFVRGGGLFQRNVWKLDPKVRGIIIETRLARLEYGNFFRGWYNVGRSHNGYFPLVDFQKGNTLVSLKSVDTTGKSWFGRMQKHIDDLATRKATVNGTPANKVLDIRVQPGGVRAAQGLIQYGRQQGIHVIVKEFR